jgi:hypothetical protein
MFLRMGRAGETGGSVLSARQVILFDRRDRRERIANNYYPQAIVERRADGGIVSVIRGQTGEQGYGE